MTVERAPAVYIMASRRKGALYTGVTSNLVRRVAQHKMGQGSKHTAKYNIKKLVWYQSHPTMESAITMEKRIKFWSRARKESVIEESNPRWEDLYGSILG